MPTNKNTFWNDVVFPLEEIINLRGTIGVRIPRGVTSDRPASPESGDMRFNSDTFKMEFYVDDGISQAWQTITTTGGSGGEANTGENIGDPTAHGIYAGMSIVDSKILQFRKLIGGTNVSLLSTATDITISATSTGEANGGINVGAETEVFHSKAGTDLQFRTLKSTTTDLTIVQNGNIIDFTVGALGDQNAGANIETGGEGTYHSMIGSVPNFRSLRVLGGSPSLAITDGGGYINFSIVDNPVFTGKNITIPSFYGSQTPANRGMIYYDLDTDEFMGGTGSAWVSLSASGSGGGSFVPTAGGTMTGDLVLTNDGTTNADLTIEDGNMFINTGSLQLVAGDIIVGGTVDGVDVSAIGSPVMSIDADGVAGELDTGFVVKTSNTSDYIKRQIDGTSGQISVSDSSGVSGNPKISISDNAVIGGTGAITIPSGFAADQPTGADGMLRMNIDNKTLEYFSVDKWFTVTAGSGNTIAGGIILDGSNNLELTDSASITFDPDPTVWSGTIGGRDPREDGKIIDQISTGGWGFLVAQDDTFGNTVVSTRTILGESGISIDNGIGDILTSTIIKVDITNAGVVDANVVDGLDEILVYDKSVKEVRKSPISYLGTFLGSAFLPSSGGQLTGNLSVNNEDISTTPVTPSTADVVVSMISTNNGLGTMIKPVQLKASSGSVPLPHTTPTPTPTPIIFITELINFGGGVLDTTSGLYTPPSLSVQKMHIYEISVYVRFVSDGSTTVAGRYDVEFLVGGSPAGNINTINLVNGQQYTATFTDIFEWSDIDPTVRDTYGIQITNVSDSTATDDPKVEEVVLYIKRLRTDMPTP